MEEKAIDTGHSTPKMAAQYAERVGARVLMLYHFSQRYKTVPVKDTVSIMRNNTVTCGDVHSSILQDKRTFVSMEVVRKYR
jgi:ribonuclease BN (tRNA processing enzyme)